MRVPLIGTPITFKHRDPTLRRNGPSCFACLCSATPARDWIKRIKEELDIPVVRLRFSLLRRTICAHVAFYTGGERKCAEL
jgi:hypothetical protein